MSISFKHFKKKKKKKKKKCIKRKIVELPCGTGLTIGSVISGIYL